MNTATTGYGGLLTAGNADYADNAEMDGWRSFVVVEFGNNVLAKPMYSCGLMLATFQMPMRTLSESQAERLCGHCIRVRQITMSGHSADNATYLTRHKNSRSGIESDGDDIARRRMGLHNRRILEHLQCFRNRNSHVYYPKTGFSCAIETPSPHDTVDPIEVLSASMRNLVAKGYLLVREC